MFDRPMKSPAKTQSGASLIEVLVAILLLSFGMLSLASMMAYAVQMPKLSAYRATAANLAASHVERMRANTAGFALDAYKETMTYGANLASVSPCAYPACTADTIATLDKNATNQAIRSELPGNTAGMRLTCTGACSALDGDLWIMWQEPSTFSSLSAGTSDECPDPATAPSFTAFTDPAPRCLHIRFKL
ncbi:MAG: type IV pilus modification protein PilV [Polaromonas sp.]|nr:type IV pilus modification protein PilV [Polaromonas sp.]